MSILSSTSSIYLRLRGRDVQEVISDRYLDIVGLGALDGGRQQDGAAAGRAHPVVPLLLYDETDYFIAYSQALQMITAIG